MVDFSMLNNSNLGNIGNLGNLGNIDNIISGVGSQVSNLGNINGLVNNGISKAVNYGDSISPGLGSLIKGFLNQMMGGLGGNNPSFSGNFSDITKKMYTNNLKPEMKYFNTMLFDKFQPSISGYVLVFMVPPAFKFAMNSSVGQFIREFQKLVTFACIDFTPPQIQVEGEQVSGRNGGTPYATEIFPSGQCSLTFIENSNNDIYKFHHYWVMYIRELLEGIIQLEISEGSGDFIVSEYFGNDNANYETYGALDYAASFYVVTYDPSMQNIGFVGKCTGVYPQSLPSKEMIGQRSTNNLTTLPFTYSCAYYEEALDQYHPIYGELMNVLSIFGE